MADGRVAGVAAVMEYDPDAKGILYAVASVMEYVDLGQAQLSGIASVMEYAPPEPGTWIKVPAFEPGWKNSGYGELGPVDYRASMWFHIHNRTDGRYPNTLPFTPVPDYAVFSGTYDVYSPTGEIDLSRFANTDRWAITAEVALHWDRAYTGGFGAPELQVGYRLNAGAFVLIRELATGEGTEISDDPGSPGSPYWRKEVVTIPPEAYGEATFQLGFRLVSNGPHATTDVGPCITGVQIKIREV